MAGTTDDTFIKSDPQAPPGYFRWEEAGLEWLRDADAVPVVEVRGWSEGHLALRRLSSVPPDPSAARSFGRALARTHDAGAAAWGCGPPGWTGDGFFGPLAEPLPLLLGAWDTWGAFYAEARLEPTVRRCRDAGQFDERAASSFERLIDRVGSGDLDTDDGPARLHGDLWSGNVMWTPTGGTLIDPAAHGGHRETDLALLALFGAPHLDEILVGYDEVHPPAEGRAARVELHQLHCLLAHAVLFGGGYAARAFGIVRGMQ